MKPHALRPFYRAISHWCIFLSDPSTYGWKDNVASLPPIHVHIHRLDMTDGQRKMVGEQTGMLFPVDAGGIVSRSAMSQIAKGHYKGESVETLKPEFIRSLVASWPDESTIIWCHHNDEQKAIARLFPDAGNITGTTPYEKRASIIESFQAGRLKTLVSKPKLLGWGLNLQICTQMIFNGTNDSWEEWYQAIKRANRVGSTRPLNVHAAITELEEPMLRNVLRKADRIAQDTLEHEKIFRESSPVYSEFH
jgi:hypothetical protein